MSAFRTGTGRLSRKRRNASTGQIAPVLVCYRRRHGLSRFPAMGLYHLLYQSQALATFSLPELLELLQKSRAYNNARSLTGILLHAPNGQFLHLLEGEKDAVQLLYYHRIAADPRHEHLVVLSEGPSGTLVFADWNMSFRATGPLVRPSYLTPGAAYFRVSNLPQPPPELKRLLLDFTAGYDDSPLAESMIGSRR